MKSNLRVLFLAAEAEPFVKVGGLGDVAGSLPCALRALASTQPPDITGAGEIDIRLALPFHSAIKKLSLALQKECEFIIPYAKKKYPAQVFHTQRNGVSVYLIDGPFIPEDGPVYCGDNVIDGRKFTFFSLAALELARRMNWAPDILHANDWHTAPAVYALQLDRKTCAFFKHTATLLGVHNLPYTGQGAGKVLREFGLPPAVDSSLPAWAQDVPLALGLYSADHIVAVSPTYATEILTPEFGAGLEGFLSHHSQKISGILNGLDMVAWDPAHDNALAKNYDRKHLEDRGQNRNALLDEVGLDTAPATTLFGLISRLDRQKGIDLALEALRRRADLPWQVIILGSGAQDLEVALRQFVAEFPQRARAVIGFDAALSRKIYAGADAFLIPSRYEPCGLAQMIAMRYGCIPVARATGGLRDTITDASNVDNGTGFLFEEAKTEALEVALQRVIAAAKQPHGWRAMQNRAMEQDFSWGRSAQEYYKLYQSLIEARLRTGNAD